jgi:hypothetical protein
VVDQQDEHAAPRHPRRRRAQRRHPRGAAAHRGRRADALRPRDHQPAILAELREDAAWPKFPERFRFGWCPEGGKKADLMFLQHMLAVLRPGAWWPRSCPTACCFAAAPSGTSAPASSNEDLLDAVIGLAPNLFYGTGIPACILVLRAPGAKPKARRARCSSSTPTASTARAARRTTCFPSTSRRSSALARLRRHRRLRAGGVARRAEGERRQPQHPPLRRQRAAARAPRRARASARRDPPGRGWT